MVEDGSNEAFSIFETSEFLFWPLLCCFDGDHMSAACQRVEH